MSVSYPRINFNLRNQFTSGKANSTSQISQDFESTASPVVKTEYALKNSSQLFLREAVYSDEELKLTYLMLKGSLTLD